jgi:hypothetical protein
MSNRRRYERRDCAELVNICTDTRKDRAGLARDVSATGLRFQSVSKFAVGERVDLTINVTAVGEKATTGRVVRVGSEPNYESVFPHSGAIEFDEPEPELLAPLLTDSRA